MRKLLVILAAVVLAGCQTLPAQKEIVYVDKPVAFIPKPPNVPKFKSEVDKLTLDDAKDPGKVGQAYKHDMAQLRALNRIYEQIMEQYWASSQDFDVVNREIDALVKRITETSRPQ